MTSKSDPLYQEFKAAFEKYYQALCHYAYGFINDRDSCEDLVQEIFVKIWENKKDLLGSEGLRFYLYTAVKNNCLSFIQKRNKSFFVPIDHQPLAVENLAEEKLEGAGRDSLKMVQTGLSRLPPKCKDAFLLSRIGNFSYKEIAEAMDISIKTVENQIGKAIRILRDFSREQKMISLLVKLVLIKIIL